MRRQKIGVDIDDVLAKSVQGFTDYSNRRWQLDLKVESYTENWAEFWGVPIEEGVKRADAVHASGIFGHYRHFEDAVPVLKELAKQRDLLVITSRHATLKPETELWLERHFSGIFKAIHYAGIWDSDSPVLHRLRQTKAEICRELGVEYLIDDQPKHCLAATDVGIKALLFGDYAWGKFTELPQGVARVKDWAAVLQYFDEQG